MEAAILRMTDTETRNTDVEIDKRTKVEWVHITNSFYKRQW